jgi:hypothetical protein
VCCFILFFSLLITNHSKPVGKPRSLLVVSFRMSICSLGMNPSSLTTGFYKATYSASVDDRAIVASFCQAIAPHRLGRRTRKLSACRLCAHRRLPLHCVPDTLWSLTNIAQWNFIRLTSSHGFDFASVVDFDFASIALLNAYTCALDICQRGGRITR